MPTFIAGTITEDKTGFKFLRYVLYSISVFLALLSLEAFRLSLSRAFGVAPTTTETSILTIVTYFNVPILTFLLLILMLLGLGIIMYLLDYLANRTVGRTP